MAFITRQGKGSRLTIEETDGTLNYLFTASLNAASSSISASYAATASYVTPNPKNLILNLIITGGGNNISHSIVYSDFPQSTNNILTTTRYSGQVIQISGSLSQFPSSKRIITFEPENNIITSPQSPLHPYRYEDEGVSDNYIQIGFYKYNDSISQFEPYSGSLEMKMKIEIFD
jgi:hypothetical protein